MVLLSFFLLICSYQCFFCKCCCKKDETERKISLSNIVFKGCKYVTNIKDSYNICFTKSVIIEKNEDFGHFRAFEYPAIPNYFIFVFDENLFVKKFSDINEKIKQITTGLYYLVFCDGAGFVDYSQVNLTKKDGTFNIIIIL